MLIDIDLAEAFCSSEMGLSLFEPFPPGTMHRGNLVYIGAWVAKYRPIVKHRTPKKRKRKRVRN